MEFKDFLFSESKQYLAQKCGDVLSAVESLSDDSEQMGNRAVVKAAEDIVSQVRRILHGRWEDDDLKYLKKLQKVGVGIMRGIDSKDDMGQIVSSVGDELKELLDDLEVPVNRLGNKESTSDSEEEEEVGAEL